MLNSVQFPQWRKDSKVPLVITAWFPIYTFGPKGWYSRKFPWQWVHHISVWGLFLPHPQIYRQSPGMHSWVLMQVHVIITLTGLGNDSRRQWPCYQYQLNSQLHRLFQLDLDIEYSQHMCSPDCFPFDNIKVILPVLNIILLPSYLDLGPWN
jgi:hypothetical protein